MKLDWKWVAVVGIVAGLLGVLAWRGVVHGDVIIGFLGGSLVPMLRSSSSSRDDNDKPPPASPPALPVLALALLLAGCAGAQGPGAANPARDTARASVLLVAEGAKVADAICGQAAISAHALELAKTCADAYDVTRDALLAAQSSVDTWEAGGNRDFVCALGHGVRALAAMSGALTKAGVPIPAAVADALSLGAGLAGGCKGGAS